MRIENIEFDPETGRATLAGTGEPLKFPESGVLESQPADLHFAPTDTEPVWIVLTPEERAWLEEGVGDPPPGYVDRRRGRKP